MNNKFIGNITIKNINHRISGEIVPTKVALRDKIENIYLGKSLNFNKYIIKNLIIK